jgi:hypothetical protein
MGQVGKLSGTHCHRFCEENGLPRENMSAAVPTLDAAVWPSAFASSGATYASGGCDSITAFQHKEASTSAMQNPSGKTSSAF